MNQTEQAVRYTADDVSATINSLQALLSAVDDKVRFYLMEGGVYGPYQEIVQYHAGEIEALLAIMESLLHDAAQGASTVTRHLYAEYKRACA